jgi:hypothetical protein
VTVLVSKAPGPLLLSLLFHLLLLHLVGCHYFLLLLLLLLRGPQLPQAQG